MDPRARGRAGMMAMAFEEVHCVDLRGTGGLELGGMRAMRSEGRRVVLGAQLHRRTESEERNLALTSPTPQPRGRRA